MKHLIKIESTAHGVLGVMHAGLDQQYCEAGEIVTLKWQPDAKWGLQEAHYTDGDGNIVALTRVKENGADVVAFIMPNKDITIGGTFKRFVIEDWTGKDAAFSIIGSFDVANLPTLDGFADAGKVAFVKDTRKYATWDGYGWTYMDGKPVTPRYLTFTANEDGSSVGFCCWSEDYEPVDMGKNMQYSTDGGKTWQDYTIGVGEENIVPILLDNGENVMFRGNNETLSYYLEDDDDDIYTKCVISGSVAASGDATSLLNGIGGDVTLASGCYGYMFQGCTGLTQAPALPSTTLASGCYGSMFYGCTGLTQAPALPATTLASDCYNSMFQGCTGLTQAPALPATTLASYCYNSMFYGCTGILSHDIATLNISTDVFANNSSCASLTIHAKIPPTISNNTITGLKADCVIYVPSASVDAYKAKQYWSARAAYIQAIP